jgi:hypothetical protein
MTTLLQEWRRATTHELVLPSGLRARLKRLELIDLVGRGAIPDTLSPLVVQTMGDEKLATEGLDLDEMRQTVELINLVCMACFVEPQVTPEPTEESIGVYDVPFADRSWVFHWANSAAEVLKPFRAQPEGAPEAA